MTTVHNLKNLPTEVVENYGPVTTLYLSMAAGSEKLYVNIDVVAPGASSTKYHAHTLQEEFFLILKGSGILRMNNEEIPVTKGDFVAKPAGKGIAYVKSIQKDFKISDAIKGWSTEPNELTESEESK